MNRPLRFPEDAARPGAADDAAPPALVPGERFAWRPSSAAREALKWLAAALMVADHLASHVLAAPPAGWHQLGRLVFPVFGLVLAVNLAERGDPAAALRRALPKLMVAGVIAQPLATWLRHEAVPNVLFTLALGAWLAWPQLTRWPRAERAAAWLAAFALGWWMEFSTFGVLYVWACARWAQAQTVGWALLWLLALADLVFVNGSFWALAAVPVLLLAQRWPWAAPRRRWPLFFYVFYPAHFAVLGLIRAGL